MWVHKVATVYYPPYQWPQSKRHDSWFTCQLFLFICHRPSLKCTQHFQPSLFYIWPGNSSSHNRWFVQGLFTFKRIYSRYLCDSAATSSPAAALRCNVCSAPRWLQCSALGGREWPNRLKCPEKKLRGGTRRRGKASRLLLNVVAFTLGEHDADGVASSVGW